MRWLAPSMPALSFHFGIRWDDPPNMPPFLLDEYLNALHELNRK